MKPWRVMRSYGGVDTFRAERDRYRTALEQIAKYGLTLEQDLTQRALNGGDDE